MSGYGDNTYGVTLYAGDAATNTPPTPIPPPPVHAYVVAETYATVTMNGTRPVITGVQTAQARRQVDRIVIGGQDVTVWRGVRTPIPTWGLVVPLLYGSGSVELPQVAAAFETPGLGALSFLAPGAAVRIERLNPTTGEVVAVDYRGFVDSFDVSGRTLRVGVGGEATGRASLTDRQPPIFRRRNDLGRFWADFIGDLRLDFAPTPDGPDTGVKLTSFGGMGMLEYAQRLSAAGVNTDGTQWTCMPREGGTYRVERKDLTTIAATVYFDDAHTVPNLRRDIAEEPNRIYATGVTPAGRRVKFGVYPVLADRSPEPYPGPLTQGSTGDGVTALIVRLSATGYLALEDREGGYDIDVTRAVRDLQDDAGLPKTGNVDEPTWNAAFDVGATGYSVGGSHIEPAAQRSNVRQFRRSAAGNVIGVNPDYDPSVLRVDRTLDMGTGITQSQMHTWARRELAPTPGDPAPTGSGNNWAGTIVFNTGALVKLKHTPGTAIQANDVFPARDLRPGQNVWAPRWDGGTLFHVSGVDIGADGVVTATVDTQARDTMKVWEVLARNVENRRDPARAWIRNHRSSALTKDAVTEFDEVGGIISQTNLAQGWNVIPVVAGQEGTIARLRLNTTPSAEYVVAVFGKQITPAQLANLVPSPLTAAGTKVWAKESTRATLDEDYVLLYVVGDNANPCGYFPKAKTGQSDNSTNPSTAPLTGRWKDDAGFAYRTFDQSCVLWMAIYADRATTLAGGRVMYPQLEAGS